MRRRRAGGLAGMSLVATTGLFGAYLGNPRMPRAYAAALCTVTNADDLGPGSLRQALLDHEALPADCTTIDFDQTYFATRRTITLGSGLPYVTSTITIDGPGSELLTIDGGGFYGFALAGYANGLSNPDQTIDISGLTITDTVAHDNSDFHNGSQGGSQFGGGLWAFYANAVVTDVTLSNDSAVSGGGALAVTYGTLSILDSTFDSNSAQYFGGALYAEESDVTISGDTTFSNNSVDGYFDTTTPGAYQFYAGKGGAISLSGGSLHASGTSFTSNSSIGPGGAIAAEANASVTIDGDAHFGSNVANSYYYGDSTHYGYSIEASGGAIYGNTGTSISVDGATFLSNESGSISGGGAIAGDDVTVSYATFSDNSAGESGGAIYVSGSWDLTLDSSAFSANSAATYGGAVFSNTPVSMTNSTMYGNSSYADGGAIYAVGNVAIYFSTITGNHSTLLGDADGVYAGGDAYVRNSIIWGNTDSDGTQDLSAGVNFAAYFSDFTSIGSVPYTLDQEGLLYSDPLLGILTANGGPTQTMMPGEGSPAIEAADPAATTPTTDQRGYTRSGRFTIGAVQVGGVQPAPDLSQLPPSWHQATMRPDSSALCADGSNPSWAQWPNGDTGGWTCEETTWWDVNLGTHGGWVTSPGFRSNAASKNQRQVRVHHYRHAK